MIAIIDYGVGNLFSVEKAFVALGAEAKITNNPLEIKAAEKLVLPGVGAFGDCMKNLEESGLIPLLKEEVVAGKPLLGICVGLQILFDGSEESPEAQGLGFIPGQVKKIQAEGLKVPHMGCKEDDVLLREVRIVCLLLEQIQDGIDYFSKCSHTKSLLYNRPACIYPCSEWHFHSRQPHSLP